MKELAIQVECIQNEECVRRKVLEEVFRLVA